MRLVAVRTLYSEQRNAAPDVPTSRGRRSDALSAFLFAFLLFLFAFLLFLPDPFEVFGFGPVDSELKLLTRSYPLVGRDSAYAFVLNSDSVLNSRRNDREWSWPIDLKAVDIA